MAEIVDVESMLPVKANGAHYDQLVIPESYNNRKIINLNRALAYATRANALAGQEFAQNAAQSATGAQTAQGLAEDARDAARLAATEAYSSAADAATYADNALASEHAAQASAQSAAQSAIDAAASKTAAQTSEANIAQIIVDTVANLEKPFKFVQELPQTGNDRFMYFVPKTDAESGDLYDEYVWNGTRYEPVGSRSINFVLEELSEADVDEAWEWYDRYIAGVQNWNRYVELGYIVVEDGSARAVDGHQADIAGDLVIPSGVSVHLNSAFRDCTSLECVVIQSGATIGFGAFQNCSSLERIVIPETVTVISSYSFSRCNSLKDVTIPSNVVQLGEMTFWQCVSLESVVFENPTGWLNNNDIPVDFSNPSSAAGALKTNLSFHRV